MPTLADLDHCTTLIAALLRESTPLPQWCDAQLTVRSSPADDTRSYEFTYTLADGTTRRDLSPPVPELSRLSRLVQQHRAITRGLGQPPWFRMSLRVSHDGRFEVGFEYRDDYRPGDVVRGA